MPGFLLNAGATVSCAHSGEARPASPNPRVLVSGQPIVMQPEPYVIVGCPFATPAGPMPCVTANWVTGAKRITSDGMPVLLMDSMAVCVPTGTPLIIVVSQNRVQGI